MNSFVARNIKTIERIARIHPAIVEITSHGETSSWGVQIVEQFECREIDRTSFVSVQFPVADVTFLAFTDGFIDLDSERMRLTKAIEVSTKEAKSLEGRLSNAAFVEKAKPEAVDKARADHAMHAAEAERLAAALERLG